MCTILYFSSIYFYICAQTSNRTLKMQTILNDIELDMAELKCLIQAMNEGHHPSLVEVARRNIRQMQRHLEDLAGSLQNFGDDKPSQSPHAPTPPQPQEPPIPPVSPTPPTARDEEPRPAVILAERIRPAHDLRHALSLNDTFRFSRELFGGDTARMHEVLNLIGQAGSLDEAIETFTREAHPEDGNEAVNDFNELLKKYFNP